MENTKVQRYARTFFVALCGITAAVMLSGVTSLSISRSANATPAYAQQTSKACGYCHQNAAGGGALKAEGEKFKANGHNFDLIDSQPAMGRKERAAYCRALSFWTYTGCTRPGAA